MNRKRFLSSLITAAAIPALPVSALTPPEKEKEKIPQLPPYLQPGDIIGITCPAGYILREDIKAAVRTLENWGFTVRIGNTVGQRDYSFGGTDTQRLQDMQAMLDAPEIKAILCGRGGYGTARIIDQLDFTRFRQQPKWVIGFSDVTVLHCHINRHFGIASLHSKMCNSFPDELSKAEPIIQDTIASIQKALTGQKMQYTATVSTNNRTGGGSGVLIGGNLSIIQSMCGTNSDINTNGKILFLEETGEYLYSLDRMLNQLQRTHKLNNLAGLIIGGFNHIKPDDPGEPFGRTITDMVMERVKEFNYPVCFQFPVGHQKDNYALKCGVMHHLLVTPEAVTLQEM